MKFITNATVYTVTVYTVTVCLTVFTAGCGSGSNGGACIPHLESCTIGADCCSGTDICTGGKCQPCTPVGATCAVGNPPGDPGCCGQGNACTVLFSGGYPETHGTCAKCNSVGGTCSTNADCCRGFNDTIICQGGFCTRFQ